LINPSDERIGEITLDRLGAAGIEELVTVLTAYRISNGDDLVERVVSAVKRFGEIRVRRNNIVHAVWVLPNHSNEPEQIGALRRQFRKGINTIVSTLSPENIAAAASDASRIGQELEDLYEEISRALSA
jgi:hypothetical protein